jgi:phosphoglycerate kinase
MAAFAKQTIHDLDVHGRRVLVRVDFNVPMSVGAITDDTRIRAALPTIDALRHAGARVVLMSHLGRPDGKVVESMRLAPIAAHLADLLGAPVTAVPVSVGPVAKAAIGSLHDGDVCVLENLRFHEGEEANDDAFAAELAALGEIFVNDAFGTAHRAHASTEGVGRHLPAVAGLLLEREVGIMGTALANPARPFVAIVGGKKVSEKIGVLRNVIGRADHILIGGAMANTFLLAQGHAMGASYVERSAVATAAEILTTATQAGTHLELPSDLVVAPRPEADAPSLVVGVDGVPADQMALDIGPETVSRYGGLVRRAGTIIWNGPMGVFEVAPFAAGTTGVAHAVALCPGTTIVGGGDSVAALEATGLADRITHVSTGGGASLEFLEGKVLPGVAVLRDRQ